MKSSPNGSSRAWQWFSLGPIGISLPKNARSRPLPKIYSRFTTNGDTRLTSWIERNCRTPSLSRMPSLLQSGDTSSRGLVTRSTFRMRRLSPQHARGQELMFFTQQLIKQTPSQLPRKKPRRRIHKLSKTWTPRALPLAPNSLGCLAPVMHQLSTALISRVTNSRSGSFWLKPAIAEILELLVST